MSEGYPPTDTKELITIILIKSTKWGKGRHTYIKTSISISRMDMTLGPSIFSLEHFSGVTSLEIKPQ